MFIPGGNVPYPTPTKAIKHQIAASLAPLAMTAKLGMRVRHNLR